MNNSLKSRRAYQKRRRECGWQEEASAPTSFLQQGSTLSTLLQTFRQQQQTIQTSPTSVAEMLRRTNSLDPIQMRSSSPAHAEHHSTTLADSPLAETMVKGSCTSISKIVLFFRFHLLSNRRYLLFERRSPKPVFDGNI